MPATGPQGIVAAVVTPFRQEDERIDYTAWQTLLDILTANGVDGVLAAGGQGEFFALQEEERIVALRFCRQHLDGRAAVYGNVGCVTTRQTVRLAQAAESDGMDFAVVVTPYYLRPTQDELVEHYVEVCRSVHIPVLAYNIPDRTGVELSTDAVRRIAQGCDNFAGLKDSSGNLDHLPELVAIGNQRPFSVFIGRDHMIFDALRLGCAGAVTACANVAPKLFANLYRSFRAGDLEEAKRLQGLVDPLRHAFSLHTFPSVVKEALALIGIPAGPCRRPVGPMPEDARRKLAAILETLKEQDYLPRPAASSVKA